MNTSSRPAHASARSRSMLRIFLSSTSVDLKAHRTAARRLIDTFDEHPVVMDDFGAHDGGAIEVSLEWVRRCDVYVLLLGWRYGTIPDGETLSVTHLEYRAVRDAGMPRFIFLADADTEKDDGPDALFPATVRDIDHADERHGLLPWLIGRNARDGRRYGAVYVTPGYEGAAVWLPPSGCRRGRRQ